MLDPKAGGPNMWLKPLTPQDRSPLPPNPACHLPFPESPPTGTGPDLMASLPFLSDSMCVFLTGMVVQESVSLQGGSPALHPVLQLPLLDPSRLALSLCRIVLLQDLVKILLLLYNFYL